jgi:protein-S-isoprenylcysteine O-methyltransferase
VLIEGASGNDGRKVAGFAAKRMSYAWGIPVLQIGFAMTAPLAFQSPQLTTLWWVTLLAVFLPETVMSARMRSAASAVKADRGSKMVVILTANFSIVLGYFVASWFPSLNFGRGWRVAFFVGLAVLGGGMVFRWYAIRMLGRFFTFDVAISAGQTVIETGPYRWIRHPSYAGSLVGYIGVGLTLGNWVALLVPAMCMAAAYSYRIPVEEQALVAGLGPAYEDYRTRTWRLVPFVY